MNETVELGPVLPVEERAPVPRSAKALAGLIPLTLAASIVTAAVGVSSSGPGHLVGGAQLSSLRSSGDRLQKLGSYHATITETLHAEGVTLNIDGRTTYDAVHHLYEITMSMSGPVSRTFEEITDGTSFYLSTEAGHWGKAPVPSGLARLGQDSNLGTLGALDKVRDRGPANVDGAATEHYSGVISAALLDRLQKVFSAVGADNPAIKLGASIGLKSLANAPVQVYVDHQGLPRKMTFSLHISVLGHTVSGDATSIYTDFGQPADITVPPTSETTDYPSLQAITAALESSG